jgi:hypothetical protein
MSVDVMESVGGPIERRERLARLLEERAGEEARRRLDTLLKEKLGANAANCEVVLSRYGRDLFVEGMANLERRYREKTAGVEFHSWLDAQSWVEGNVERLTDSGRALVVLGSSDSMGVVWCEYRFLEAICLELLRLDGELVLVLGSGGIQGFALDLECSNDEFVVRALGW